MSDLQVTLGNFEAEVGYLQYSSDGDYTMILAIALGIAVPILLVLIIVLLCKRRKAKKKV